MASVRNDPDSMEIFTNDLCRFIDDIQNALNVLNGAYSRLGEDWQDSKRAEFDEQIGQIQHSIQHFSEFGQDCINHLRHQIQILRDYESS